MIWSVVIDVVQWLFLLYFAGLQFTYFALNIVAFVDLLGRRRHRRGEPLRSVYRGYEPSVSIIMPAYNEQEMILEALRTMLNQDYPALQIVIVNDGSKDRTLDVLKEAFDLVPFEIDPRSTLDSKPIRQVYRSRDQPDLVVVDKENGGKADALNAGINFARHDLVCMIDADTVFEPDCIRRTVELFMERPETIAAGGSIMPMNGSLRDERGFVVQPGLATNFWARIQTIEYVRAFLFGRLGWVPGNALLVISGAFGVFDRRAVVAVGGYRRDTVGEDMELTVRLHRWARDQKRPYRIAFVPGITCWTEVPERGYVLQQQRIRWHQGLSECISIHRGLLFRHGALGWLAMPVQVFFEWLSPLVEVSGYVFAAVALALGFIDHGAVVAFLTLSVGLGILLSVSSLLLQELVLRAFPRFRDVLVLCGYAVVENVGYRQVYAAWRIIGFLRWAGKRGYKWH